jgi:Sec-independent protein translocase protein TatA
MGCSLKKARTMSAWIVLLGVSFLPSPARAQEDVIQFLKNALAEVNNKLNSALQRIDQLEKEKSASVGKIEQVETATSARLGEVEKSVLTLRSAPSALNPAIGLVLDATVEHRSKAGGDFNFRSAELGVAASVDPYARVYSFINGTRDGVEVDEAAARPTSYSQRV